MFLAFFVAFSVNAQKTGISGGEYQKTTSKKVKTEKIQELSIGSINGAVLLPMQNKANQQNREKKVKEVFSFEKTTTSNSNFYTKGEKIQWDILYTFNGLVAGAPGIETDGTNFYTTLWNGADFHRYNMDGTNGETFTVSGVASVRDMAYDGTYFYGAAANMSLFQMDLANETLVSTINASCSGVTGIRHISYDPTLDGGNGGFWIGNWNELGAIAMDGSELVSAIEVADCYGSAYDNWTDAANPCLWLFHQGGSGNVFVKFDINTLSLTGVEHDASDVPGNTGLLAGGACTYEADGLFILVGTIQQDPNLVFAYELAITADPNAPGAATDLTAVADAGGAYTVELNWTNPAIDVAGNTLTDLTSVYVYLDGDFTNAIYTNSSPTIGGADSYTATVTTPGTHTFTVYGANGAGEGLPSVTNVFVGVDVEVSELYIPEYMMVGSDYVPVVNVVNSGVGSQTFNVTVVINDGSNDVYTETLPVTNLANGTSQELTFTAWTAVSGDFTVTATASDPGNDIDMGNNVLDGSFPAFDGCMFGIELFDSYGDGWNGSSISVYVSGALVLTATIETGDYAEFSFPAESLSDVQAVFDGAGSWLSETSWSVKDGVFIPIIDGAGADEASWDQTSSLGVCPVNGHDLAVVDIAPTVVIIDDVIQPVVTLFNLGNQTETDFTVTLTNTEGYTSTKVLSGESFASLETFTVTMDDTWTATTAGEVTFTATVTVTDDLNADNNTMSVVSTVHDLVYVFPAYADNTTAAEFVGVVLGNGEQMTLGETSADPFPMASTFINDVLYIVKSDASFAMKTGMGQEFPLGFITGFTGTPVGLAWNETAGLFVLFLDGSNLPHLCTLDLNTLVATEIGTGGTGMLIGMDFAADGFLYAPSLDDDMLYQIDPATGATTVIGEIGLDLNYGQDVSFDTVSGQLYTFTGGAATKFGTYDLTTGAFNEIADYTGQFATFAIYQGDPPTYYDVTFTVTDGTDPVPGAEVALFGNAETTNLEGVVVLSAPNGTWNYSVSNQGYVPADGSVTIADNSITENVILEVFEGCSFNIELIDSYGDGWNGNTIDIFVDGVNVLNATIASGDYAQFEFPAEAGNEVQAVFNGEGSWLEETSWIVNDGLSNLILEGNGADNATWDQTSTEGVCPNIITFKVSDEDGGFVEDAYVYIEGLELITNIAGIVMQGFEDGTYDYTVVAEGFANYTGSLVVAGSNADELVTLTPGTAMWPVNVTVYAEQIDGEPTLIDGAVLNYDGADYTTVAGMITLYSTTGDHAYTITANNYDVFNGSASIVLGTNTIQDTLALTIYNTVFTVTQSWAGNGPVADAAITVTNTAKEIWTATTATDGTATIEGLPIASYEFTVSADGYADGTGTFDIVNQDITVDVVLDEDLSAAGVVTAVDNETEAEITWDMNPTVQLRHDDGTATGQLGFGTGTDNSVLGSIFNHNAEITEISWFLTEESAAAYINLFVFGLKSDGTPDESNLLFSEMGLTTTFVEWNTFVLPESVDAPNGFYLAASTNGFLALATDDGIGEPYVAAPGMHYYSGDYTGGAWTDMYSGFPLNFLFRPTCRDNGPLAKNTSNVVIDNSTEKLTYLPLETPIVTVSEQDKGTKSLQSFDLFFFEEADMGTPANWTTVTTGLANDVFNYTDNANWPPADEGMYYWALTANYETGSSDPTISNGLEFLNYYEVTFNVTENWGTNDPINGAEVTVTDNDEITLTGTTTAGAVTFELPDRDYDYTVTASNYVSADGTFTVNGGTETVDVALDETVVAPSNLEVLIESGETTAVFNWNTGGGVGEDFYEDFESGTLPTGWLAVDNDGDGFNWINTVEQGFDFDAYEGDGCMTSASYDNTAGALTPDNYLITPAIQVGSSSVLSWYHDAQDPAYSDDFYYVKLSTTGTDIGDFTEILWEGVTSGEWEQVTVDLSDYSGTVYLAFQHTNCYDMFWMKLDNVSVSGTKTKAEFTPKVVNTEIKGIPFRTSGMNDDEIENKYDEYTNSINNDKDFQSYTVYLDGTEVAAGVGETTYTFTELEAGTHTAGVKSVYDSGESDIIEIDFICNVSVEELANYGISVYPNPSNGVFTVNVTEQVTVETIDITGKIINTQVIDTNNSTLNIATKGVYFLRFTNNNYTLTQKVIVK